MNKLQFDARVSWTDDSIISDWTLTGQPPGHSQRAWASVEAWGAGRPDPTQVDGVWLLMKEAPYYHFISARSVGAAALQGELRGRGITELPVAEVKQRADQRAFADLRVETARLFGSDEVWQLLENDEDFARVNVRTAVVRLSKGDHQKLHDLVAAAKRDWRDVLMWAQKEHLL